MRFTRAAACWFLGVLLVAGAQPRTQGADGSGDVASFTVDVWDRDSAIPLFDGGAVVALVQSRDGYLWLGTLNGLVRFDGVQFTIFDENNTPELPSNRIVHLFEDSKENLWIGTETAGAALVKAGEVQPLDIGRGSREGRLIASCEDASGRVWLYTARGELCRCDGSQVDVWTFLDSPPVPATPSRPGSAYRTIIAEKSGLLRVGTDWRISVIDPDSTIAQRQIQTVHTTAIAKLDLLLASHQGGYWRLAGGRVQKWKDDQLERDYGPYLWGNTPVSSACEDEQGNLVVGTLGAGLFWYQSSAQPIRLSTDNGLSNNYLLSLCFDREGGLWIGTDGGGLNRVRRNLFNVVEESRGQVVQAVATDRDSGVWVGYNGGGIDHWQEGRVRRYGAGDVVGSLSIRALLVDRASRVWVGTWGAGLMRFQDDRFERVPGTDQIPPVVQAMFEDRDGKIWVGTEGGLAVQDANGWRLFTVNDGLSASAVRAIASGPTGDLWIGTWGGGLNLLRDGSFTVYRKANGFPGDEITALHMDDQGVLWVGTSGQGLIRFKDGSWTRFTTREGLASNSIGYLVEDADHDLWIGSNAGLMRISKHELTQLADLLAAGERGTVASRTFGHAEGLPTSQCTLGAQLTTHPQPLNRLWFPTILGLAHVDPAAIQPNPHQPPVAIEAVFVNGEPIGRGRLKPDWTAPILLRPAQERLEIHYASLNLAAPGQARFRYRMEGHESDWIQAGDDRVARYSKLPPGQYEFAVTASNEDGVWNETGSRLSIVVEPPFWRTWWFMGGSTVFFLCSIVGGVYYFSTQRLQRQVERLRQQQALDNERARIARDLHDQLGASLTQVALLGELVESDKDLPNEVESHARQISQTARETTRTLDEIVWAVNPSNDTLDGLITYFCKYAQEYLAVAGIRYRLDVPAQLPSTPLAPDVRHNLFLSAKEAITNIVRHAGATAVHIRLQLTPRQLVLEIVDDGCGLEGMDPKRAQTRNGLRNMRKRMEEIGGVCTFSPSPDKGTIVSLTAPLQHTHPAPHAAPEHAPY